MQLIQPRVNITDTELMATSSKDSISESSTSFNNSRSTTPASTDLLSVLRCPNASELARKRMIDRNSPKGKKRFRGEGVNDPKSVAPHQHVRVFPNGSLTVSNSKLFCQACWEELSLKKCVVSAHLQSAKHKSSKKQLAEKEKQEMDIAEALRASDSDLHPKGETLPQDSVYTASKLF